MDDESNLRDFGGICVLIVEKDENNDQNVLKCTPGSTRCVKLLGE